MYIESTLFLWNKWLLVRSREIWSHYLVAWRGGRRKDLGFGLRTLSFESWLHYVTETLDTLIKLSTSSVSLSGKGDRITLVSLRVQPKKQNQWDMCLLHGISLHIVGACWVIPTFICHSSKLWNLFPTPIHTCAHAHTRTCTQTQAWEPLLLNPSRLLRMPNDYKFN